MARPVAGRRSATAALPEWIRPQLTELVDAAPEGQEWLHEIKLDGYRMHARLDRRAVRLLTRTGLDWTHKYPPIAAAVASLGARQGRRSRTVRRPDPPRMPLLIRWKSRDALPRSPAEGGLSTPARTRRTCIG